MRVRGKLLETGDYKTLGEIEPALADVLGGSK